MRAGKVARKRCRCDRLQLADSSSMVKLNTPIQSIYTMQYLHAVNINL